MPSTVVYIHGNGNKARAENLKAQWDIALFGESIGDRSRMAYWAPLRYAVPLPDVMFDEAEHPEAGAEGLELPVGSPNVDPEHLTTEAWEAASTTNARTGGLEGVSTDEAAGLDGWLRQLAYTADALVAGEAYEAHDGEEVLPLPRCARVALFRALVKVTFKDVHAYFFGGFGEPMREVVRTTLREAPDPVVVVAHSLGTIIAYDVLREEAFAHREAPMLLTAGSPLGTREVQDLIVDPLEVPAGVAAWHNVADARDLVALDPTIRPEYAPEKRCADFLVTNDSGNHHGIREYLMSGPVRDAVRPLVG